MVYSLPFWKPKTRVWLKPGTAAGMEKTSAT
jgi:hypothetical protein